MKERHVLTVNPATVWRWPREVVRQSAVFAAYVAVRRMKEEASEQDGADQGPAGAAASQEV